MIPKIIAIIIIIVSTIIFLGTGDINIKQVRVEKTLPAEQFINE